MPSVLLALGDLGLAMPLQETLESMGHTVTWDGSRASGPGEGGVPAEVVVLDADMNELAEAVQTWGSCDPPPAILVAGPHAIHRQRATEVGSLYISSAAQAADFDKAIATALRMRFAGRMSPAYARGALALGPAPASGDRVAEAAAIIANAERVDIEIVRACLRRHTYDYVTSTDLIPKLREARALPIPQVGFSQHLDGTRTVKRLIATGGLEPATAGRVLWALLSTGAARATLEPPDLSTPERWAVSSARDNLRARHKRLARATLYDVLEVTPMAKVDEIEQACRSLAIRYSPDVLKQYDLGELNDFVATNWKQILQARHVLSDMVERGRYNDTLRPARGKVVGVWAFEIADVARAAEAFRRGQAALLADEAFKAVSAFASACRSHPEHPDYEASLCWARFRAEVERGNPREQVIGKERQEAEQALAGRRPWPRALVALAMLCAADGDADAARSHLREALKCDPNLPAAVQLLKRLGARSG